VELKDKRVGAAEKTEVLCPFKIIAVGVPIVWRVLGVFIGPVAAILDIALKLMRVGSAATMTNSLFAAPAGKWADAGRALVVHDIVGISAGIARTALSRRHAWQPEAPPQIEQHALKRPDVTVGRDHRLTDGIGRPVGFRDRPVE